MGLDVAALVEPIAVGWHAVKGSGVKAGDAVLVMGAGPIAIGVILSLQAQGVENIAVAEVSELRSEQARNAGARHVFNPLQDDIVQCSKDASEDGYGPHVIYECAGVQASMEVAIQSVRGGGTIMNIGIFEKEVTLNWNLLNRRSLKYIGSNIYTKEDFQEVINAIADGELRADGFSLVYIRTISRCPTSLNPLTRLLGQLKEPERMITSRISLEEGVEKGINALINEREKHCKILVGVDS